MNPLVIPCPNKVVCPDGSSSNLEFDSPFANLTAEAPDSQVFISINYGWDQNIPRLGWTWKDLNIPGICESTLSQADATACSAVRQITGTVLTGNWQDPTGNPIPTFANRIQSCVFTCPDGLPFTWTVVAGYVQALSQAQADLIANSIACNNAQAHFLCLPSLPNTCVGANYLQTIQPTFGVSALPPFNFTIASGTLPPGLSLFPVGPVAAQIIGNPTAAGTFAFTLRVTDANGNFMQKAYMLNVLGITNLASVPSGMENTAYSFQLNGAGGIAPFTFALTSGSLPGITLSSTGLLSGTPNYVTAGSYPFTVNITDSTGATCSQNATLKVTLRPGPDWTQLVWSAYPLTQSPPDSSASGQGIQNTASGALQTDGIGAPGTNPFIRGAAAAGVTYTGPQVTSRIIVTLTTSIPLADNSECCRIFRNGVQIGGYAQGFTSGTFQFDFIVPVSVGAVFNLDDNNPGNSFASIFGGIAGNLSFTWAIVNV